MRTILVFVGLLSCNKPLGTGGGAETDSGADETQYDGAGLDAGSSETDRNGRIRTRYR